MSKHRVLSFKPQLRLEWRGQDGQNETEQPNHSASLGDSITSSTRMRFSVHTENRNARRPPSTYLTAHELEQIKAIKFNEAAPTMLGPDQVKLANLHQNLREVKG